MDDAPAVATLEPTLSGAGGVATTTSFRLTSLDGTAPADLVARLRVDPPIRLAVAQTDGPAAVLRPEAALRPATLYRFSLLGAGGIVAAAWAAQTAGPLRLVESIPEDGATRVPLDAGIELVFDQPGVSATDLQQHLTITPTIAGHVEAAGRQLAFVPSVPLTRATLYTVTLTSGLPIAGTDQRLEASASVRFETAGRAPSKIAIGPRREFLEATPRDAAAIALWVDSPHEGPAPARVPVTVHRLRDLDTAERAWRAIAGSPTWTRVSTSPAVSTAGLPREIAGRLAVHGSDGEWWLRLPRPLPLGWYVVTVAWAGIPHQAVLQVTDLATYALVTTTRSAVWLNDLRTTRPIPHADVMLAGRDLGVTDGRGLVTAATPPVLETLGPDDTSRLVEVRDGDRAAFQPVPIEICATCDADATAADAWWHLLTSDRSTYRATDTVNAWGVVRERETGKVPASLHVTLLAAASDTTGAPPISAQDAAPDARGAFAVTVPLHDLPHGSYRLDVRAGAARVGELWFDVGTITKPAYRLALTSDHDAAIRGEKLTFSVHGSFFEGTPVAGTALTLSREEGRDTRVTTNADGDASSPITMRTSGDEQWSIQGVEATPTLPEEAGIGASRYVAVFAGSALVDTAGILGAHRVSVTGRVSDADLSRFDGVDQADLYTVDAHGAPRPGATVVVKVIEHRPIRHQAGSRYDFVLKRVTPVYDTRELVATVATRTVVTGRDGTFRVSVPVAGGDRSYAIRATYLDEAHRRIVNETWAGGREGDVYDAFPQLLGSSSPDGEPSYGVGDTVRVRFQGGIAKPPVDRYLFAVVRQGLGAVSVQGSSTFATTFGAAQVPGIDIFGVRFTGLGYEIASPYAVTLRLSDRKLSVDVSADRDRYAPGETAKVTVRTRDASGRPVAASVFVQAVDEKLFAAGDASLFNPIDALYQRLADGVLAQVRSHETPADDFGEGKGGGDTTGGDDGRSDFRDWLVGKLLETDATGTATLDVPLSDDLTSWHVTAEAVDAALQAGAGEHRLAVALPLFAEATIPATLLASDKPIIRVRAFGGGLRAGEAVTISVSSDTLAMATITREVPAFGATEIALPALTVGLHRIRVEATTGSLHDAVVRTVNVLSSRAERDVTTWAPLVDRTSLQAGGGMTHLVLVDAGRGRVVPVLQELAGSGAARSDLAVAAGLADRTLAGEFRLPAAPPDAQPSLDPFATEEGMLALVPWGGGDLDATALAAMAHDPRLDPAIIGDGLHMVLADANEPRPRRLLALAGLAGLGQPVLSEVRDAARAADLTVAERVSLALAALYAGDEVLARSLEHRLLAEHASHLGPWTRIDPVVDEDSAVLTARLAIVAASLGEPVAAEMDAWVAANPPKTTTAALERALAARGWAQRVPASKGVAALTVDGTRREIAVGDGASPSVDLTPAQAASAAVEPVSGAVLVVTTRSVPLDPGSLTTPAGQRLERILDPAGRLGATDTVRVTLRVELGAAAGDGCWRLTDLVPSGLAPIGRGWMNDDGEVVGPDTVDGQRVAFCITAKPGVPVQSVRYLARVVDAGTYTWEPAVLQSTVVPDEGVVTAVGTVTIAGTGD